MTPAARRSRAVRVDVAFVVASFVAFALSAGFSSPGSFAAWWPPAGVLVAYLVRRGVRGVVLALVVRTVCQLTFFTEGFLASPVKELLRSVLVVAAYLLAGWLFRRLQPQHMGVRLLGAFVVAGVVVGPVLAGLAVVGVSALAQEPLADPWTDLRVFVVGDATGVVAVMPALLVVARRVVDGSPVHLLPDLLARRAESALQAFALVVLPAVLAVGLDLQRVAVVALSALPLLWVALRQSPSTAAVGVLVVNVALAYAQRGFVGTGPDAVDAQALQLLVSLAAVTTVALRAERGREADGRAGRAYRRLLDAVPEQVVLLDRDGRVVDAGGAPPELARAVADRVARAPLASGEADPVLWDHVGPSGTRRLETRLRPPDPVDGVVLTVTRDLTDVHALEEQAVRDRETDPVTGLLNEQGLRSLLSAAPWVGAVVVVHLDRWVERTHALPGRTASDVAVEVSGRLRDASGSVVAAARTDVATFVLLLDDAVDVEAVERVATHLRLLARLPVRLTETAQVVLGASVGVAPAPGGGAGGPGAPGVLLRRAEAASVEARQRGGDAVVVWRADLDVDQRRRQHLVAGLTGALDRRELAVHYQPEVDLPTRRALAVESLVRWPTPTRLVEAWEFVGLAEEFGLVDRLGWQVLDLALADARAWPSDVVVGVNVAAAQLDDPDLVARVLAACERYDLDPRRLRVEVTETAVARDRPGASARLGDLRRAGASVALDDFGTGWSSMDALRSVPADVVKVDRTFVSHVDSDSRDEALVRVVVDLAAAVGLDVVAEGVERQEQVDVLQALGCRRGQGYLFDPAVPVDVLHRDWLRPSARGGVVASSSSS